MFALVLLLAGVAVAAPPSHTTGETDKCGYNSCTDYKPGYLNVHIVPHTHDDVGWLKTVDQYYYGNRNDIQKAGVQYILDSVVKELWEDPKRRFIYVETAFFHKWWVRQTAATQAKVHTLVRSGRLKFVSGAWSMNDEATTHYQSTIDQFTWGLKFLNDTFGECGRPNMGWQIDPFGHSKEFASLLRGMGFDALFLGRIDYQDKRNRLKSRTMEFEWQTSDVPDANAKLFTHVLYNTYSPPPGFCFDVLCNDAPIIDDEESPDYNVDSRVSRFLEHSSNMSRSYSTDNILVTMGEDFNYQDAYMWFTNLDKLIMHGNRIAAEKNMKIAMYYSTPDCYYDAVRKSKSNAPLSVKSDDFFPYASDPHSYWTGYFTSRPTVKYLEAETNRYLQMVKQLQVLADLPKTNMKALDELKSTMGVLQHHDAITGTEKQHVTYDYVRMATKAINDAHVITTQAFNKIMFGSSEGLKYDRCRFNESSCATSENVQGNLIVTVYNPLAWTVTAIVKVPNRGVNYIVHDPEAQTPLKVQNVELFDIVTKIPTRKSEATHELIFMTEIKGLGFKTFYLERIKDITKRNSRNFHKNEKYDLVNYNSDGIKNINGINELDNQNQSVDGKTGNVFTVNIGKQKKVATLKTYGSVGDDEFRMMGDDPMVVQRYDDFLGDERNPTTESARLTLKDLRDLRVGFSYYPGYIGNNEIPENRSSGAYIFRPKSEPRQLAIIDRKIINGDLVYISRFKFEENAALEYRIYGDNKINTLDWIVGPISTDDGTGKEYVMKYASSLITNGEFYTDSNGRQVLKRKLDERDTWNLTLEEHVAGNYYPITNLAYVKSDGGGFMVSPDRPEGTASLEEGGIELMVHRRLLHDDAFGVGEALNETELGKGLVVKGTHLINTFTGNPNFKDVIEFRMTPQVFVSGTEMSLDAWRNISNKYFWLKNIPDGVHLLTLEPFKDEKILIRFENYLDAANDATKEVDLYDVLKNIKINSVKETYLAADRFKDKSEDVIEDSNSYKIKLRPKEIRTFTVDYEFVKS